MGFVKVKNTGKKKESKGFQTSDENKYYSRHEVSLVFFYLTGDAYKEIHRFISYLESEYKNCIADSSVMGATVLYKRYYRASCLMECFLTYEDGKLRSTIENLRVRSFEELFSRSIGYEENFKKGVIGVKLG